LGSFYLCSNAFWSKELTSYLLEGSQQSLRDYLDKFMKIFLDNFIVYNDMITH
jgi:hypothetical protein